jgi:hypothetical protein
MDTHSIGPENARRLYDSGWWQGLSARRVALLQLKTTEAILPTVEFHRLLEEALGHPILPDELLNLDALFDELSETWE